MRRGPAPGAAARSVRASEARAAPVAVSPRTIAAAPSAAAINWTFCSDWPASTCAKTVARLPYLRAGTPMS
jgi:hypothetical protein